MGEENNFDSSISADEKSVKFDGGLLDLIQGADVEWKTLGEACDTLTAPSKLTKKFYKQSGKIPIIDQGEKFIAGYTDGIYKTVSADRYIIFGDHSEHIKFVDFEFIQGADGLKILKAKPEVDAKFLYYAFKNFYQREQSYKRHWTKAKETKIPIPSLEIQQKVVEILDKMTDYVTELTAELTLRQKQYSYYRDQLLTFPSQSDSDESLTVRWLKMGEFGQFIGGNGMQKKDFVESGFPAIHYGQIYTKYGLTADETFTFVSNELASKLKIADKNDLIIATTSENVEDILKPLAWLGGKVAIGGHESLFKHNENVKYLAYYFQTTEFQKMKQKYIVGTKVKDISKENLSNLIIPLPNLTEQKRIVEILDKFDKLTSDLSEGLPREIELRQKQYEYWREQLLSFKKE
ncbi:restriction endonuclease subunit S [Lactococcus petauri]|uniref:restriction endonuclease subunit S n=1 Tax=Lactococcus petauri TaxID=1940789 RepID=UPI003852D731